MQEKADALLMQCKQPPVSIILPEEVTTWLQSDAGRSYGVGLLTWTVSNANANLAEATLVF